MNNTYLVMVEDIEFTLTVGKKGVVGATYDITYMIGDLTGDKIISITDLVKLHRHLARLETIA